MTSVPVNVTLNNDNAVENDENLTLTINDDLLPAIVTRGVIGKSTIVILRNDCKLP